METNEILDFRKHEDIFYCIEVLTQVRVLIAGKDPSLSQKIDTIMQSLMAIQETINQAPPVTAAPRGPEPEKQKPQKTDPFQSDDDKIEDIFTGEILNK